MRSVQTGIVTDRMAESVTIAVPWLIIALIIALFFSPLIERTSVIHRRYKKPYLADNRSMRECVTWSGIVLCGSQRLSPAVENPATGLLSRFRITANRVRRGTLHGMAAAS